mmetsp:Transcript_87076/g.281110  ORF Transcript_87076/g.281110 Transcript_87076/m.281110 type:complete len:114 (-) Transcript_87076:180-521(-)
MAPPWLEGKSADSMAEVELGVELLDTAPPWSAGASADKLVVRLGMDPKLRAPALSTHDSNAHSTIAASRSSNRPSNSNILHCNQNSAVISGTDRLRILGQSSDSTKPFFRYPT